MNEHKLSALMRYQAGFRKYFKVTGALTIAVRFLATTPLRTDKLSGAARKRAWRNAPYQIPLLQYRVKRGNPARNPTALA